MHREQRERERERERERGRKYPCRRLPSHLWAPAEWNQARNGKRSKPSDQILKQVILSRWPDNNSSVPKEVSEYFSVKRQIGRIGLIIFKGQRFVIPQTLRQKVKKKIHSAHIGILGCLRRAWEVVYWPSMNKKITDYTEHCDTCACTPTVESWLWHFHLRWKELSMYCRLLFWLLWNRPPWEEDCKSYHHWVETPFLNHGIPNLFQSDNGPPFDSQEFRDFAEVYEFEKVTNSPNYPQSNGHIENAEKTAKQLIRKSKQAGTNFYLLFLDRRNTPTEGIGSSPVRRLCGRRTRTLLPTATSLLKPTTPLMYARNYLRRRSVRPSTTTEALESNRLRLREKQY